MDHWIIITPVFCIRRSTQRICSCVNELAGVKVSLSNHALYVYVQAITHHLFNVKAPVLLGDIFSENSNIRLPVQILIFCHDHTRLSTVLFSFNIWGDAESSSLIVLLLIIQTLVNIHQSVSIICGRSQLVYIQSVKDRYAILPDTDQLRVGVNVQTLRLVLSNVHTILLAKVSLYQSIYQLLL